MKRPWQLFSIIVAEAIATSPPLQLPADWQALVRQGQMVWSPLAREAITPGAFPMVGNGNLALLAGPAFIMENKWPWRDAGALKLAGVFNGRSFGPNKTIPSHRAQLPPVTDFHVVRYGNASYTPQGMAVDFSRGMILNRTHIDSAEHVDTVVETRLHAHQQYKSLLVFEVAAWPRTKRGSDWRGCDVELWRNLTALSPDATLVPINPPSPNGDDDSHSHSGSFSFPQPFVWFGQTLVAEEEGLPLRRTAYAFDDLNSTKGTWKEAERGELVRVSLKPPQARLSVVVAVRSDLDTEPDVELAFEMEKRAKANKSRRTVGSEGWKESAGFPPEATAAVRDWTAAKSLGSEKLLANHVVAWHSMWAERGGLEIKGNASLAATINACQSS